MKKIFLLIILASAIPTLQAQKVFHKFLTQNDVSGYLYRSVQLTDGGYATAGLLNDNASFDDDFLLAKFNIDGKRLWIKSFGSDNADDFSDVIETTDGGIVAVGTSTDFNTFISTAVVVKYNSNGSKVWSKTYSLGSLSSAARKVQKDASGNLYVLGTVEVSGSINHYSIMKLDSEGNILQQSTINSTFSDFALSFIRRSNGEFIIGGWGNNGTGESIHVIKLNSNLSVAWNKYIGGSIKLFSYDMKEKSNGNLVFAGRYDDGVNPFEALIFELEDATGNVVWAKRYSKSGNGIYVYGLAIHTGDRIGVTGVIEDFNSGMIAFEVGPTGAVNWSKRITSANELASVGYGICKSYEGGFMIVGSRNGIDSSCVQIVKTTTTGGVQCMGSDLGLVGTDITLPSESLVITSGLTSLVAQDAVYSETSFTNLEDACDPVSVTEQLAEIGLAVYPNPSEGHFVISCSEIGAGSSLRMFNTSGTLVYQNTALTSSPAEIDLQLQPGIYFLQLNASGKILTKKVIIR